MKQSSSDFKSSSYIRYAYALGAIVLLVAFFQNCGPNLPQDDTDNSSTGVARPTPTPGTTCFGCTVATPAPTPTPAPQNVVIGYLDGFAVEGENAFIVGWACASMSASSIDVHIYRNAPAGSGTILFNGKANLSSEAGVAQMCMVSQGAFRFRFPVSNEQRLAFAGQRIFAYGISPSGGNNPEISNSGNFAIPAPNSHAVFRFWRKDAAEHFFTLDPNEGADPNRFSLEGEAFRLFNQNASGMQQIYRCSIPSADRHFLSLDSNCEGNKLEGSMGFTSQTQGPAAPRVLIRCYVGAGNDHLMVVGANPQDAPECVNAGYTIEGAMGYVP